MFYVPFSKTLQCSPKWWVASLWQQAMASLRRGSAWPAPYWALFVMGARHITSEDVSSESEVRIAFSSNQDRLGSGTVINPSESQRLTTQMFISFSLLSVKGRWARALLHTVT